jgi:hypothetical protein
MNIRIQRSFFYPKTTFIIFGVFLKTRKYTRDDLAFINMKKYNIGRFRVKKRPISKMQIARTD